MSTLNTCNNLNMTIMNSKQLTLLNFLLIFSILNPNNVEFAVSDDPSSRFCDRPSTTAPLFPSNCEGGDWGGFLQRSCCGAAFSEYLYSLSQRANKTRGKLFQDSAQQKLCLASLARYHENTLGCGIDKLVSGSGGCSDFSDVDVSDEYGDTLRGLDQNCGPLGSYYHKSSWERDCDSCVKSWDNVTNDLCRFSVLVSFTSKRLEDTSYISTLFRCLGTQVNNSESQEAKGDKKSNISKGVWIVIGGSIGVLVIVTWLILCRRYTKSRSLAKTHVFMDVLKHEPGCQKVSIKEVYSATNNLSESNLIGQGTSGKVYKGVLSNNQAVAIKHIVDDQVAETFVREVTSLSHIRHPNLVALVGCCVRKEDCFLVYELCPNGSLSEWLFGKDKALSWIQRLSIAIDSARALAFLHTYPHGNIVHRDIKPTNILLGENLQAKVSDFGLSKVIRIGESCAVSEVRGTFGYVDPDYRSNCVVKSSGDVYSFGLLLLQIISGKRVVNIDLRKPMALHKMAKMVTKGGKTSDFADPKLEGLYSVEAFEIVLHLALSCTVLESQRPSMEQVVAELQNALHLSTKAHTNT